MDAGNTSGNEYLSTGVKICNANSRELVQEGDRLRKMANDLLAEQKQTGKDLSAEILAAHTRSQELYRLALATPGTDNEPKGPTAPGSAAANECFVPHADMQRLQKK